MNSLLSPLDQDPQQLEQGFQEANHSQGQADQSRQGQVGGDSDLSRSLERIAVLENWLGGDQSKGLDGQLLGNNPAELSLL